MAILAPPAARAQDLHIFRIGTGFVGGVYYPVGELIANAITPPPDGRGCQERAAASPDCGVPGVVAVAQASNGSVANLRGLAAGELEAALVQADVAHWGRHGEHVFHADPPMAGLRAIASLYPESLHVVTRADAGIRSIADIRGKRMSLDELGSGTLVDARLVLAAHGVAEADFRPEYIKPLYGVERMARREMDGFMIMAGIPTEAIRTAAAAGPIFMVPVAPAVAERLGREHPFLAPGTIPEGVYPGVPETPTLQVRALFVTTEAEPDDLIHAVTRTLWGVRAAALFAKGHPQGRHIRRDDALTGLPVPLHPGAERWYREQGMLP